MGAHEPKGETPGAAPAYLTTPPLGTVSGLSPAGQQRAGQWAGQRAGRPGLSLSADARRGSSSSGPSTFSGASLRLRVSPAAQGTHFNYRRRNHM